MNKNKIITLIVILAVVVGGGYLLFTLLPALIVGTANMASLVFLLIALAAVIFFLIKGIQKLLK